MIFIVLEAVLIIVLAILLVLKKIALKKSENQLLNTDSQLDSLRVVNHDYKNKMHVLMGYIETERFTDAKQFINDERTVPAEELIKINDIIKVPDIASLLVGKLIEARMHGITINIMPDSVCESLSSGISKADYVTVIGNLVQNSIDELGASDVENKCIDLFINTGKKWSMVSVMDNGRGISPEQAEDIMKMGYTTKGGINRGLGLGIVKDIAEKNGGSIEIESELNEGTEISVSLHSRCRFRQT